MRRKFFKNRLSKYVAAAMVLVVGFGAAASATPAGTVDYGLLQQDGIVVTAQGRDIQQPTTADTVKFGAKIAANASVTVNNLFFACRTSTQANCDFGLTANQVIGTTVTAFEKTKVFPAVDTYTVWLAYEKPSGTFVNLTPPMSVAVAAPPPPPATNVALNKTATANAQCNGNETPAKAVNGTVNGGNTDKWCAPGSGPKWLKVDLGSNFSISSFNVRHAGAGGEPVGYNTRDFTIDTSTDNVNFTTVATVTGNTANVTTHAVSQIARYVRLNITLGATQTNSDGTTPARIYEFEAMGVAPPPDSTAPSVPSGVTATATSSTSVTVNWTASTDNIGVTGYDVRRDGTTILPATGLSLVDSGRSPSTTYSYEVRAKDAAGNLSAWSAPPAQATTPAPPAGPIANCFGDVKNSSGPIDQARLGGPGCGYPTLATTGVPSGTTLTAYTGPSTITVAGTVIDSKTAGCLDVQAANVTIKNSRITGPCFWNVETSGSGTLLIQDSEINCVNNTGNGVSGSNFVALRLYIHNCENASEINANSQLIDSYLHVSEVGAGHADDIQSQGGNNVVIRHNTFAGLNPITSSIISNPTQNSGWLVENNFFSAGAFTLYCPENVSGGWTVRNNRFYAPVGNYQSDPHRPAFGFTDACGGVGTWTGNYRDDTLGVVSN